MEAIIVTGDKYPCEDAGAIRQHAIAKILQCIGYKVIVIGYGTPTDGKILEYDGVEFLSYRVNTTNVIAKVFNRLIFGHKALSFIKSRKTNVDIILVVDILPVAFKRIERYSMRKNIKILHDSVEWYSPEEFSKGRYDIEYQIKNLVNTRIIKNNWRVIAISNYLEEHFKKVCKKVIKVPVVMDIDKIEYRVDLIKQEKKIFSYVGGPGKKDYLKEIIEGFLMLEEEYLSQLELHIVGVNYEQLVYVCDLDKERLKESRKFLVAHGRLPHVEAVKWVRDSDFTLLLRDETLRYAKAGFPTKVVESLSYGTPMICNLSSDLSDYLYDMQNSVLIKGHNPKDVKEAIQRALYINEMDYIKMRKNARKSAEKFFDYKIYCDRVKELLD